MNRDALLKSIRAHEGTKLKAYLDSEGVWTIGTGKNLQELTITDEQAKVWLLDDVATAIRELDRAFHGWRNHSEARQNVLIELCFQLGAPRLAEFKKMWRCLALQDYAGAALELLASKYAGQVPKRAHALAKRLETDSFE